MRALAVLVVASLAPMAHAAAPIPVKIAFVEALAPRDTTSSERFQKDFDLAIETGKRALGKTLQACGYSLQTETAFYDASDPLQARERGAELQGRGTWLIVGPRRSNHYVLLAQGAEAIPTVSLMASSSDIAKLGPRHTSLSPLNQDMALQAAIEASHNPSAKRGYIAVVSSDCSTCQDFAEAFTSAAEKRGIRQLSRIDIAGEDPDPSAIAAAIRKDRPGFVLLPNYSKVSSRLMAALSGVSPGLFFVGGDGWGDASFGFVQQAPGVRPVEGFSVRGYPPVEKGLAQFALGREVSRESGARPAGAPALGILRTLDEVAMLLCHTKPKSGAEFTRAFESTGSKDLTAPWGTSLYRLKSGNIVYLRSTRSAP